MRRASISAGKKAVLLAEDGMGPMELRKFCEYLIAEKAAEIIFLVSRKDEKSLNFAIGSPSTNLKPLLKVWNQQLHGRGGGKDIMQGSFQCELSDVEALVDGLNQ